MFIIAYKKVFIWISVVLVTVSLGAVVLFGLPLGIDFTGGSALELEYVGARPEIETITQTLAPLELTDLFVQPAGEQGVIIKTQEISDETRAEIVSLLSKTDALTQNGFTTIGPSVGAELTKKAFISIVLVLIAIVLFIAYTFRKVSTPVSSWKFGFATIIALIHDTIIPLGAFAIIAHYTGVTLDTLFIVAVLTTLALSISDTIVVFDRVRERLTTNPNMSFEQLVGKSLSETFVRSLNTSLLSLVTIVSLAIFGPESTQLFAVVLAIGVFFGIYSSLFLASPLLVLMQGKKD